VLEKLENLLKWKTWVVFWRDGDALIGKFRIRHLRLHAYADILRFVLKHGFCEVRNIVCDFVDDECDVVSKVLIPKDKSEFLEIHYIVD
jgi:hypothetical protein